MTAAEREISGLLDRAFHFTYGDGGNPGVGQALATEAIGRGLLALIPLVREIGDQLDTLPRVGTITSELTELAEPPADPLWDSPLYKAAAVIERFAISGAGPVREHCIARLVLGHRHAADLAVNALHGARDAGGGGKVKAVEAAIATLGIELDAD